MEKIRQEKNLNIPNLLTSLRLILLPVFVWLYLRGETLWALIVYLVVQATDVLDGIIARRSGQITTLGKLLDPLADKLMLLSVLVCFGVNNVLPWWMIATVLAKELLMIIGSVYALRKKIVIAAVGVGKAATVTFAVGVVGMLINKETAGALGGVPEAVLYAALVVSLVALAVYIGYLLRLLHRE